MISVVIFCVALGFASASVIVPQPSIKLSNTEFLPLFPSPFHPNAKSRVAEQRITNGEIAKPGQFPYQVGLSLEIRGKLGWCGGSLISSRYVVTAAHCTFRASGVTVYVGAHNISNSQEESQQRIYCGLNAITVHEEWSRLTLQNDISLIKTPVEIIFSDIVQPIKLPKMRKEYPTFEKEIATASGWGKESDESTTVSSLLRFIDVPIMPMRRCNVMYLNVTTDDMICIDTTDKKSTCNGDSGGPLVVTEDNDRVLIGLTSFGISLGCEKEWPGVFTRLTSYLDWIKEKTNVSYE